MMKSLFVFIFSINLAFASSVEECSNQLSALGDGSGKNFVSSTCFETFKSNAPKKSIYTSDTQEIIALKNSFYIKDIISKKELITAGRFTTIKDIAAMDYDKENNEVAILEKGSGDILFFSSIITGNVAPYRTIRTEQLFGAIDIKVFNDEVFVLNSKDNSVIVYNRLANFYGRKDHKNLEILRSYNNVPIEANSIELINDEMTLLDIQNKKIIYSFSKN
jgi:hypothetical protein